MYLIRKDDIMNMEKKDIVQGNLYQNKYDKTCIIIATHQEENESYTVFSGVNLSDGIYNFDWELFAFDDYNVSGKGKHLIQENLYLKERIMEIVQKNIDQQRKFDQRFCDLFDKEKVKCDTKLAEQEKKFMKSHSERYELDAGIINRQEEKISEQQIIIEESAIYIGELKKFIQHLQDYISAKHLESEGLILEKYLQEENKNGSKNN